MRSPVTIETATVTAGVAADRQHGAVMPPLYLSSNYAFDGFGRKGLYDYTRSGNPTRDQLGRALADLEGGAGATVTASGMAAVTTVLQLVRVGERVVAGHDCYGGTHRLLRGLAARGCLEVEFVDLTRPDAARDAVATPTRVVWIETPSNPLLRITDIEEVARSAHRQGALVVVDNTFLSPVLQRPLDLGADIVVHSTTKYLNGHSDVVGGAVVAREQSLVEELGWWANCLGVTGAPFDAYLTLRGLRTLHARVARHLENAAAVVDVLVRHAAVRAVYYPGLATHSGHGLARAQQSGFGSIVSFELDSEEAVSRCVSAMTLFTLAESLGGVESLVSHPATMTHASMTPEAREVAGITGGLVRLSVGIESERDLVRDLVAGLDAAVGIPCRSGGLPGVRPVCTLDPPLNPRDP